jgi:hypothetical protein
MVCHTTVPVALTIAKAMRRLPAQGAGTAAAWWTNGHASMTATKQLVLLWNTCCQDPYSLPGTHGHLQHSARLHQEGRHHNTGATKRHSNCSEVNNTRCTQMTREQHAHWLCITAITGIDPHHGSAAVHSTTPRLDNCSRHAAITAGCTRQHRDTLPMAPPRQPYNMYSHLSIARCRCWTALPHTYSASAPCGHRGL